MCKVSRCEKFAPILERIELQHTLNLFSAPRRLFCDICPLSGIAVNPKLRSMSASFKVALQVEQNMMKELPAISFTIFTKYISLNLRGMNM